MRIAVLGAGIAGLTTAHHLAGHHEVVVFEARDHPGGNIRTEEVAGCRVEWGPNGFLDNEPATLELVRELGLENRLVHARQEAARRFLWRDGRLRLLPTSPPAFLRSDCLPWRARCRALLEPFIRRPAAGTDEESVHDFALRRLGRGAAEILVDAMVTGIFAGDPRRLSLADAFPRLAAMEREHGSLLKGAMRGGLGRHGTLTSFDRGMEVLIEALADRLDVRTGSTLERLPTGFDRIICTIPAQRAALLVDEPLADCLQRIPSAPIAVLALIFRTPLPVPEAFGFLVPHGQGLRILGTLYDSSIFPVRAPEGFRLFRVLIGGRRDPEAVTLGDEELLAIAARDLHRAWGTFPDPHAVHVIRHPLGIAQYEQGHGALLAEIERLAPPQLRFAGSWYRGVALNACIREARSWEPSRLAGRAQE